MRMRFQIPRALPATIVVMGALLAVKSVSLVRAAVPAETPAAQAKPENPKPGGVAVPPPPGSKAEAEVPAGAKSSERASPKPGETRAAPASAGAETVKAGEPPPPPIEAPISESERSLLLDLRQRRQELDAREAASQQREQVLVAAEKRLAARVDELGGLRSRLEELETARKQRDEANWGSLVKLYEAMKPHEAAVIFNDIEMPVMLQVLDRMSTRKAALILASMLPERARLATVQLAEMRTHTNSAATSLPVSAEKTPPKPSSGG